MDMQEAEQRMAPSSRGEGAQGRGGARGPTVGRGNRSSGRSSARGWNSRRRGAEAEVTRGRRACGLAARRQGARQRGAETAGAPGGAPSSSSRHGAADGRWCPRVEATAAVTGGGARSWMRRPVELPRPPRGTGRWNQDGRRGGHRIRADLRHGGGGPRRRRLFPSSGTRIQPDPRGRRLSNGGKM
uniref:Uncharacterized protein n=1 Tax=Arundo donax TaxID=35708 RepID=A0A0A9DLM6_ARUDO